MAPALRLVVLVFSCFAMLLTSACQKESTAPNPDRLLRGLWELDHSTNGMTGRLEPADPTRHREIFFTANGQAHFLLNGTVVNTTPYMLRQATSYLTQKTETFITFGTVDPGFSIPTFLADLSATSFTLAIDAADGPSSTYVRRSSPTLFF